jgi:hypothetical protein
MAVLPSKVAELNDQLEDYSPVDDVDPLPIYQQRDNYFT